MDFTYKSKIKVGDGVILRLWQKALLVVAFFLASLVTLASMIEGTTRLLYALSLPAFFLLIIFVTAYFGSVYRNCKCKVVFMDQYMDYDIPAIRGTQRDYKESYRIEYDYIDCVEFDPPTLQLRITSKRYDISQTRVSDGELLLDDFGNIDEPIYFKFLNKKDAKYMLELVRRYITEDYYVNGVDL